MIFHSELTQQQLNSLIHQKKLTLGGNRIAKIFGHLNCKAGKRIQKENRVFFTSIQEAIAQGYRPCSSCMNEQYKKWKAQQF